MRKLWYKITLAPWRCADCARKAVTMADGTMLCEMHRVSRLAQRLNPSPHT